MTWQDGAVLLIVGAALYYIVRKFVLPKKPKGSAATFVSIQQLKSKPKK